LPVLATDSGVAMVMSHELGHTIAGHNYSGLFRIGLSTIILYCGGSYAQSVLFTQSLI
jgi:Zn-dependent protease with chaperone function